jgi:hypothetical protein
LKGFATQHSVWASIHIEGCRSPLPLFSIYKEEEYKCD